MIKTKAPGKLMFSGEWSVLERDQPCVVVAVDKFVECTLEESDEIVISVPGIGEISGIKEIHYNFEKERLKTRRILYVGDKEKLKFAKNTVEIFLRFMAENANPIKRFKITTKSQSTATILKEDKKEDDKEENKGEKDELKEENKEENNEEKNNENNEEKKKNENKESIIKISKSKGKEKKIGFGASASTCVAVGAAIMAFYGYDINEEKIKEIIFKLSSIAHFISQDFKGSCFDVAASTYGGAIMYKKFDSFWLQNELKKNTPLLEILDGDWPYLKIKPIKLPEQMKMIVCWTKESASTTFLMSLMEKYKEKDYYQYMKLMEEFRLTVMAVIDALETGEEKEIRYMVTKNMSLLRELSEKSGVKLVTAELDKMIKIGENNGCAAKFSGAGAGDCGFAVCFGDEKNEAADKIRKEWEDAGLYPLDVKIEKEGVRIEQV